MRAPQLADRAQITYRQLDYWTRQGYIHALQNQGLDGSGRERDYEPEQVERVLIMAALVRVLSIQPQHSARYADMLARSGVVKVGRFVICDVARKA